MDLSHLNLWNPSGTLLPGLALLTAFVLGMVHGITPDEHTWPITFSYSVGSYSVRGGARAGLLFSLAFTLQRAIASELAALALMGFTNDPHYNFAIYVVVGTIMAFSGGYVLRRGILLHLFHSHSLEGQEAPRPMPSYMPLVHGFIAGWGTGAFALITYTVLAPSMPSLALAWLPGFLFGLGTTLMQVLFGALIGAWMARRQLAEETRAYLARSVAGRTLLWSGIAFVGVGLAGLLNPALDNLQIETGIRVHNLAHLGVGFFLAVIVLFGAASVAFFRSLRELTSSKSEAARQPRWR
jgi:hypothetical protein